MRICHNYMHQQFTLTLTRSQLEWNTRTRFKDEFALHYFKSMMLMCDVQVTEVTEPDSQTVAVIAEGSNVGWFPCLCGAKPGMMRVTLSLKSFWYVSISVPSPCCSCTHQRVCTGLFLWRQRCWLRLYQFWWKSVEYKLWTHTFFLLTSLLYVWTQIIVHREPIWLLPLSLKDDVLSS